MGEDFEPPIYFLLNDKTSLWARVLRSKYKIGDIHDSAWMTPKGTWSALWRSVNVGLREVVNRGIGWVLGDGKIIRFWQDRWLLSTPLLEWVSDQLPVEERGQRVADYWIEGVGWDMERIAVFLPEFMRQRLLAVVIGGCYGVEDKMSWVGTENGRFTVSSAYLIQSVDEISKQCMSRFFDRVWRVMVPERARIFLWLVGNQVVLTNAERVRRHMADSDVCPLCKGASESLIHVLRDCPAMMGIWMRVVPVMEQRRFFETSLLEWMYGNLKERSDSERRSWPTLFALTVWWGWKWRCGYVFGEDSRCRDRVKFLKSAVAEVEAAHLAANGDAREDVLVERMIAWRKPAEGWVTMNTDGASHGNPGQATAGGVIRDEHGSWLVGFALNIGVCSAPLAELWGVYYGLVVAWERGWRRVRLEVDSALVVGFLQSGIGDSHPLAFLVRLCHGFISKDWIVRITHVYREANRLADGLANYAFTLPFGFLLLDSCPEHVSSILLEDVMGTSFPRHVRL